MFIISLGFSCFSIQLSHINFLHLEQILRAEFLQYSQVFKYIFE